MTPRHWTCETADHPRACGANGTSSMATSQATGSSPRVRGKRPMRHTMPSLRRIIPARAGQTGLSHASACYASDHPRACGANVIWRGVRSGPYGSSPRVRGKPVTSDDFMVSVRIIPARAGQTAYRSPLLMAAPDHPRACGANELEVTQQVLGDGSSPRVRGKQSDFMRKLLSAGPSIIGFAQWLQSSCYCSCFQSSAKTPISRGTTPTSLFLGFQNSITLLLLT